MSMQETYAAEEMADSLNDLPRGDREQFLNEVKVSPISQVYHFRALIVDCREWTDLLASSSIIKS